MPGQWVLLLMCSLFRWAEGVAFNKISYETSIESVRKDLDEASALQWAVVAHPRFFCNLAWRSLSLLAVVLVPILS